MKGAWIGESVRGFPREGEGDACVQLLPKTHQLGTKSACGHEEAHMLAGVT